MSKAVLASLWGAVMSAGSARTTTTPSRWESCPSKELSRLERTRLRSSLSTRRPPLDELAADHVSEPFQRFRRGGEMLEVGPGGFLFDAAEVERLGHGHHARHLPAGLGDRVADEPVDTFGGAAEEHQPHGAMVSRPWTASG